MYPIPCHMVHVPNYIDLDIVEVGAVHPLYGSSKGSFYQSGSNLQESNLKAMDTSNIPTLEERFVTRLKIFKIMF